MAKKCKCRNDPPPPGVPEWVVTYGDMMSLLLCFFILLAAFSELKKEHEYQRVIDAVKEAFGYAGGDGVVPTNTPPTRSMLEKLENLALESRKETKVSQSQEQGISGKFATVRRVREGLMFTIGGNSSFDRGSAELTQQSKDALRELSVLIGGRMNKIVIRGHADPKTIGSDLPWDDLYELSYARAHAVFVFLTQEEHLRRDLFRLEACADSEPVKPRDGAEFDHQINRRVEIILTESLITDFNSDPNFTDPDNARGG